ncbi:MAG: hypothetical protein A3K19_25400 [Lentisphaerae bacterium RIFOXYB12_FULL_65_16]|nr:MAG: hypothetical protein A3K18_22075 [Lentisphaerae bacterium RIFOXYA12_64_32]OGV87650.1 MAG: hypothetical protein A3K19_25400 [Lentisphaerae bacterium RIFOXYB12_FULL_65_16]
MFLLVSTSLLLVLAFVGYLNVRMNQKNLEDATLESAERVSDVIKRSTAYHMMRNDREALYHTIKTMANEPGMLGVQIFNQEGRISFSTDPNEVGRFVDTSAEACYGCHAQSKPLVHLTRPDRFRIYKSGNERVLGIINPIGNERACSEADCHAHPAEQKILGVLGTKLSLKAADDHLRKSNRKLVGTILLGVLAVILLTGVFTWRVIHRPVERLREATERVRAGELGYEIAVTSSDQIAELEQSFNEMSRQIREAHEELTTWNRRLEERVRQKTAELSLAHDQMLQAEKLASLGKLAAVVAHEINNPLSGILSYAKLMRRWIERGDDLKPHAADMKEQLLLIESESRRCGNLVRDLLSFARLTPMNVQPMDVNSIIDRCVRLVEHRLDLSSINLDLQLAPEPVPIEADPAQVEQLLLALIINAVEAMPREGGVLRVTTTALPGGNEAQVTIADNGAGIPEEILSVLFEPFVSTKEANGGVGLGLAISRRIVERHGGRIDVNSEPGRGTIFTITLPVRHRAEVTESMMQAV